MNYGGTIYGGTMHNQYRTDMPSSENDLLPDSQAPMSKRKLIFVLSGASFALLFFLFLMGAFRSEDSEDILVKQTAPAVDEKISVLTQRIEKLEQQLAHTQKLCPGQKVESVAVAKNTQPALSTIEDAVAMTGQTLKQFISNEALAISGQSAIAAKDAAPKASKVKAKAKEVALVVLDGAQSYVVQKGDTLSKISVRFFGTPHRWKTIFEANKDRISNVNNLKVGSTIVIPQK